MGIANVGSRWEDGNLLFEGTGKVSFEKIDIPSGGVISASGTQAAAIADIDDAAGDTPTAAEFDALVAGFNAMKAALVGVGIIAADAE